LNNGLKMLLEQKNEKKTPSSLTLKILSSQKQKLSPKKDNPLKKQEFA